MLAWTWTLALALACGGDGSKEPGPGEPQACVPSTCEALHASCGSVGDGCGAALDCGGCPAGQQCGAGATPNTCAPVVVSCQPATCEAFGRSCGPAPDGCGGTLDCGGCPTGQSCGAGGTPGACAAPPVTCAPATCASLAKNCGEVPDGCGAKLACGACGEGQGCGAGGTPNVCAAPPPGPDVSWVVQLGGPSEDMVLGVGVDGDGVRYVLHRRHDWMSGGIGTLFLRTFAPDGTPRLEKAWPYTGSGAPYQLAVGPAGEVFVSTSSCAGCAEAVDFGGGLIDGETLVRLASDGGFLWQRQLPGSVQALGAAPDGGAVVAAGWPTTIARYTAGGDVRWTRGRAVQTCAVDAANDVVCAGQLTYEVPGVVRFEKLAAADGAVRWTRDVTGLQFPTGIALSAQGTVACAGWRSGTIEAGDSRVTQGDMALVVLEADGRARWARGLEMLGGARLAVDPTGRVAVAGMQPACGATAIRAFRLGGAPLWARTVPSDGACWTGAMVMGLAYGGDHALTVAGYFTGTMRVGDDRLQPEGVDAFVVQLAP